MRFSEVSRVDQIGENRWAGHLQEGWDVAGVTHGGYLQAMASRAASETVGGRVPVSVTAHFARPGHPGPVELETEVVRSGRRFSVARTRLTQDDKVVVEALGTYAVVSDSTPEVALSDAEPRDIPSLDQCIRVLPAEDSFFPPQLMGKVDLRIDPASFGALTGEGPRQSRIDGWFRLLDDEPLDAHSLILASDAFPPTTFAAGLPLGWTPTLELTVHIRDPRPSGWVRSELSTRFVTGGFVEEDVLLWDADSQLMAQARQLALVHQA